MSNILVRRLLTEINSSINVSSSVFPSITISQQVTGAKLADFAAKLSAIEGAIGPRSSAIWFHNHVAGDLPTIEIPSSIQEAFTRLLFQESGNSSAQAYFDLISDQIIPAALMALDGNDISKISEPPAPKKNKYLPTIYGIVSSDNPEIEKSMKRVISEAYGKGARSLGLETSPLMLQYIRYISHSYKPLIEYARALGMRVIPLIDDGVYEMRVAYVLSLDSINEEGKFDTKALDEQNAALTRQVSGSARRLPPEASEAASILKKRFEGAKTIVAESGGDFTLYAQRWSDCLISHTYESLRQSIAREKPDLAVMSYKNAHNLTGIKGYKVINAKNIHYGDFATSETSIASHLNDALTKISNEWSLDDAFAIHKKLFEFTSTLMKRAQSDPFLSQILNQAIQIEPELPRLVCRAFLPYNGPLSPNDGMEFLKMSITEAKRRCETTIHEACRNLQSV